MALQNIYLLFNETKMTGRLSEKTQIKNDHNASPAVHFSF